MAKESISSDEMQALTRGVLRALSMTTDRSGKVTLGRLWTLLAVAAYNGPSVPEERRLSQKALMEFSGFPETKQSFSKNIGKFENDGILEQHLSIVGSDLERVATLTKEGERLVEDICRVLRGELKRRGST